MADWRDTLRTIHTRRGWLATRANGHSRSPAVEYGVLALPAEKPGTDAAGGTLPVVSPTALAAADFVTLPPAVKGTNCANCRYAKKQTDGYVCGNVQLRGQPVNGRTCCNLWDAPGTLRNWREDLHGGNGTLTLRSNGHVHSTAEPPTDALAEALIAHLDALPDRLPGGRGDKRRLAEFDAVQVLRGLRVELEHTNDLGIAAEIVRDHLTELPDYYDRLAEAEGEAPPHSAAAEYGVLTLRGLDLTRRSGGKRKGKTDAELGDPRERAALMADILGGLFGDRAVALMAEEEAEEKAEATETAKSYGILLTTRAWNELDHPRGKDGRWIPKGSPEAVSKARQEIHKARGLPATPERARKLAEHLSILTVKQLHELKRQYGLKASARVKEQLIAKLAERIPGAEKVPEDVQEAEAPEAAGEAAAEKPAENPQKNPPSSIDDTSPGAYNSSGGGEKPKPEETTMTTQTLKPVPADSKSIHLGEAYKTPFGAMGLEAAPDGPLGQRVYLVNGKGERVRSPHSGKVESLGLDAAQRTIREYGNMSREQLDALLSKAPSDRRQRVEDFLAQFGGLTPAESPQPTGTPKTTSATSKPAGIGKLVRQHGGNLSIAGRVEADGRIPATGETLPAAEIQALQAAGVPDNLAGELAAIANNRSANPFNRDAALRTASPAVREWLDNNWKTWSTLLKQRAFQKPSAATASAVHQPTGRTQPPDHAAISGAILQKLTDDKLADPVVDLGGQPALQAAVRRLEGKVAGAARGPIRERLWKAAHEAALKATVPTAEELAVLPTNLQSLWHEAAQRPSFARVKRTAELTWGEKGYQERLNNAVAVATGKVLGSVE